MTAAGAVPRAERGPDISVRDAAALFAVAVMVGVVILGPVAGGRASGAAGNPASLALPTDEVNAALRMAAVELALTSATSDVEQRTALAGVEVEAGIALLLARAGDAACVEATHSRSPGQVWSYDAATGAIATQPC